MNWTGGALSRSRNASAKVSLSVKQKNHFAKARIKLQDGQRPPPPEVQYFDFGEWKPESGVHDHGRADLVKEKAPSQRTLDQFENVQGLVRKLKSLRPRNKGDKRKRSPINDTEGHVLPSGIAIPPVSPSTTSSPRPSSSSLVDAELSVQQTLTRLRTSTSPTCDDSDPLAVLDSVEAKRRKLLQESDWAGVERQKRMSKPVKMKFTDARDRDLIGRRRPLNGSTVQNRWNVRGSKRSKLPLMESYYEKPQGLHHGLVDENWITDGMSIRIGSAVTNKGPINDEILDNYRSPRPARRSSQSVKTSENDNAGFTPKPHHRRRENTPPSAFRDELPEPFHSLFSPEEVENSGIAQLVEAATIADNGHLSHAKDELRLPEDYRSPESEPGFRPVYEQTLRPRGQSSDINDSSSSIVRNSALPERQSSRATVEQSARPEDLNMLQEQMNDYTPVEDAKSNTSPFSIATSRDIEELERQCFRFDSQSLMVKNIADNAVTGRAQPAMGETKAGEGRRAFDEKDSDFSARPHEIQAKENIQPAEDEDDEDEIWRDFVNLDGINESQSVQEQLPNEYTFHDATATTPSDHEEPVPIHTSNAARPPPSPQDDDESIWRNFIFSDGSPKDDWIIEEEASPDSPPDARISAYDPAHSQPSMVAEAATSPVKRNPHLTDEMLDDSTTPMPDDASRYANASTSSPKTNPSPPHQAIHPSPLPPPHTTSASASSSDELSRTPSRLPERPPPTTKKGKILFAKPPRYAGPRPEPALHLGLKVGGQKKKKEEETERERERDDIVDD